MLAGTITFTFAEMFLIFSLVFTLYMQVCIIFLYKVAPQQNGFQDSEHGILLMQNARHV